MGEKYLRGLAWGGDGRPIYRKECAVAEKLCFRCWGLWTRILRRRPKAGCNCLGEIFYFDEVPNDSEGNPYNVKNTVCIHEEEAGL